MIAELTKAVQGRQTVNPRTVLGFLATVLGLILAASVTGVGILATTGIYTDLIPWLFLFCGILAVLLIVGVFVVTFFDPSRLMLGQVTGTEYAEIQKTVLGDSLRGERAVDGVLNVATGEVIEIVEPSKTPEIAGATVVDSGNKK